MELAAFLMDFKMSIYNQRPAKPILLFTLATAFICIGAILPASSQSPTEPAEPEPVVEAAETTFSPLPAGFRGIELGMEIEQVKNLLKEDVYFDFKGDPDVSLLPYQPDTIITCQGFGYVRRAFFQFNEQKLYTIIIDMDAGRIDFYSLFTTLQARYGDFFSLDPSEVRWQNQTNSLILERPVTVKYIDRVAFDRLNPQSAVPQDPDRESRQNFLNQF